MGTAFQRRSVLGIADQPELPPYSSPGPSIAMAAKPQGRRPGLFGRLGNALSRVDWERVAAAMRDDPSHMQMLMQQRENMAERARQEAEAEAERRAMKGRNEQLRGFIDTLPEDQRSIAWIAPEVFARQRIEDLRGPDYEPPSMINGRLAQRNRRTGEVDWAPQESIGASGIQYRPVSPEEAQAHNLPNNGAGYVIGSNGLPRRVGGNGMISADQRLRVEIGIEPALEASRLIDQMETGLTEEQRQQNVPEGRRSSPRNREWGASIIDMIDGQGTGAVARWAGGADFQRYASAASAFEAGMLPILSGAAVVPTEAQRMIRSALPQLGDGPEVLADKARRRRQMLNGAASMSGRPLPYPEAGIPEWASEYQRAQSAVGGEETDAGVPPGVDPQDWEYMTPEERALWQQ